MSARRYRVLPRSNEQATTSEQADGGAQKPWWSDPLLIVLFTLPGMIIFFLFVLMPIAQSAYYSLYDWDGYGPPTDYVGLGNYDRLIHHSVFQGAVEHTFIIMGLSLLLQLPLALALALLVGRGELRGKKMFRIIMFVPYVFSEVITALIWQYVFHPDEGALLNAFLGVIIPNYEPTGWLANHSYVLYSLFIVLTWKYFGFHMLLYMAGLQGIPSDLEDAARVDGANELEVLSHITLPLLGSTIRLTIFLAVLGTFQQFVLAWILTNGGGPINASQLMATYLYKYGILNTKLGYGSAVAIVLFSITLVFSIGYQRFITQQDFATD